MRHVNIPKLKFVYVSCDDSVARTATIYRRIFTKARANLMFDGGHQGLLVAKLDKVRIQSYTRNRGGIHNGHRSQPQTQSCQDYHLSIGTEG